MHCASMQARFRTSFLSQQDVLLPCRSVTMDAWSPDQLRKMQLGGNDTLNSFLSKYSVDKFTDIKEKYNSQAAEVRTHLSWLRSHIFQPFSCHHL